MSHEMLLTSHKRLPLVPMHGISQTHCAKYCIFQSPIFSSLDAQRNYPSSCFVTACTINLIRYFTFATKSSLQSGASFQESPNTLALVSLTSPVVSVSKSSLSLPLKLPHKPETCKTVFNTNAYSMM